jgi:hypothetical protein
MDEATVRHDAIGEARRMGVALELGKGRVDARRIGAIAAGTGSAAPTETGAAARSVAANTLFMILIAFPFG